MDGAVVLHQNPADAMNRPQQQPVGRTLRQQRTMNRATMLNTRRGPALPTSDSIGATHGIDINAKTLKSFGTLRNNKVHRYHEEPNFW